MSFYKDFNENNPTVNPEVKDAKAVAQWIETLLMTRKTEVLFKPRYGSSFYEYLFELIDEDNAIVFFSEIRSIVEEYDPEVEVVASESAIIPDAERNRYLVNLGFSIRGFENQIFKVPLIFNR